MSLLNHGSTENFGNASYSICNTAFIFENMQDSSPKTDIVCGESAVNWSYYRAVPASITSAAANPTAAAGGSSSSSQPKKKSSKAWIAGVIIGPLIVLAIIGAIIFFLMRRKKNRRTVAQSGGAAMAPLNSSQPPPGVGGYTDAKPQFTQQQQPQQPAYNDPYANQGAYGAQQGYNDAPISPAPQYNSPASPPPQDVKHGYMAPPMGGAAELGGPTSTAPVHQTAELGGDARHVGPGPSELPSGNANQKP